VDGTTVKHGDAGADARTSGRRDAGVDATTSPTEGGVDAGRDGACDAAFSSDPHNCGGCARSCGAEDCVDASCSPRVLVSGLPLNGALAIDSENVYFLATTAVDSVPLDGGTVRELATGLADLNYIAVDSTQAYFSVEPASGTGPVMGVALTGGAAFTLAPSREQPNGVAVAGGKVYWAEQWDGSVNGAVLSVPVGGGPPEVVVSGEVGPEQLAVDSVNVYFANWDWGGTTVVQSPESPGAAQTVATLHRPLGVAIDSSNVYFSSIGDGGTVNQVQKGGGAVLILAASPAAGTIASDGTNVYWSDFVLKTVQKVPVGGGSVVTVLSGLGKPLGIAVDGTSLYCVDVGSETILRVNK